jgi:type IV pilus assembly protein PilQ
MAAAWAAILLVQVPASYAQSAVTLDNVSYSSLPGDRVQVELQLSGPVEEPLSFAIDNPARVALDFPGVRLNLSRKTSEIGVGMARSVTAVEAAGRTRVVLNLVKLVPYSMKVADNRVLITLEGAALVAGAALSTGQMAAGAQAAIENIDFRRGEEGEGRVIVTLSDPGTVIDTREESGRIIIEFLNVELPERLQRRLDVIDFATPVNIVSTAQVGRNVRMTVESSGVFEQLAYQSDDLFTLEVKPVSQAEQALADRQRIGYTGERLSLNFQNIEVRAVLQLIADFTGFNLVASDTVGGSLTLRLKNVPWDQAMDIILKTKGLGMRKTGNVILVAPSEEIAAREKLELESQQQIEELAPLRSEFVQVNYAKASDLAVLLKAEGNSLLSERGNVATDPRTNTLLVRDTAEAIDNVRKLVARLDVPIKQVLIESRIVIADDGFNRDLGVKFGFARRRNWNTTDDNDRWVAIGGGSLSGELDPLTPVVGSAGEGLLVDLPIGAPSGAFALNILGIPDTILSLELQALQAEGRGEVLSNPRVITSDQKEASIEQGTEIPYQEASSSGATSTSFKKAVLSLTVTPQITPDKRVIMDLNVNQDTVGQVFNGVPSVDTRSISTQVLVDNGDTVVLGGIFEQTKREDSERVPFFGDLPYLGFLFRTVSTRDDKSELLIFVTPKILEDAASGG